MKTLILAALLASAPSLGTPAESPEPVKTKAKRKTQIDFNVAPAEVVIYVDGKKIGIASEVQKVPVRPGRRMVKLENGGDTTELELLVTKGQVLRFSYTFEE